MKKMTFSYQMIDHGFGRNHGSNEILFIKLTDNKTPDHKIFPHLIKHVQKLLNEDMAMEPMIETYAIARMIIIDRPPFHLKAWTIPLLDALGHLLKRSRSLHEIKALGGDEDARKLWKNLRKKSCRNRHASI